MLYFRRKQRLALIAVLGIAFTMFCIEHLSYLLNSSYWPKLAEGEDDGDVVKIMFVADPQIQGERNENYLFGWLTRWDSDRYLQKNYNLAKHHVSPDVVVFLGDLFDEGSIASDPEYRRYFQRLSTIFNLPTPQNPGSIKYVFVPGDNDVGGEKMEPVDPVKVNWFRKTFGELKSVTNVDEAGFHVQFIKMNLFMPDEYNSPLKGLENVINVTKKPDFRFIVSHVSLLSFMTNAVQQVVDLLEPNLIVSAHSHGSSYLKYTKQSEKKGVHISHNFLLPESKSIQSLTSTEDNIQIEPSSFDSVFKLDMKGSNDELHEILVPTCSYRMGVYNMGYGVIHLYQNGTIEYTVLWLPSRFRQLYLYLVVYIIMKIILTPWLLWKICNFVCKKVHEYRHRVIGRPNEYRRIV